jgi:hypothetical protein
VEWWWDSTILNVVSGLPPAENKSSVSILQETVWGLETFWTAWSREQSVVPTGNRTVH